MDNGLRQKAEALPARPGVYIFKEEGGQPIYVGKAKSLKHRVRSYFQETRPGDEKRERMLDAARDLEFILVDNEKEALALENNLIKQFKPRYNILLRDDKTYPYIKLTLKERFPRVYVTRRLKKDGARYYGPYFPAHLAYRIVDLIHRRFLVPSCHVDLTRFHSRPCLQYYIKRCLGPCVEGLTTPERYAEAVRDVRLLLEGRESDLIKQLHERVLQAAAREQFEEAARFRDQLSTVEQLRERQKMAAASGDDFDIFGFHREGPQIAVNLFHLRGGRTVDRREFFWEDLEELDIGSVISALVRQVYLDQPYLPAEIYLPAELEDREVFEEILSEKRGRPVHIYGPESGRRRALLELVARNARHSFDRRFRVLKPQAREMMESLAEEIDLPVPPRRIEAFDVSHFQGSDVVASMVVCEDGQMEKAGYRKFIIKATPRNDDFASMREVVTRRYRRILAEKKKLPDLILVDGGVGQLHAAAEALASLEIINQPLASIAKREEVLYVYGREDDPVILDRHSPTLHLIQQIRDEAHRFAVSFHRSRRQRRSLTSELTCIPTVGERTAQRLLEHFGSVQRVRELSTEELAQVVKPAQADKIISHFRPSAS